MLSMKFDELEDIFGAAPQRLNYLINIDIGRKIVYFETPKVACTSIKKYMIDAVSDKKMYFKEKSMVHDRRLSPLATLKSLDSTELYKIFKGDEYRRFSFIRNPYSRALSGYLEKIVKNQSERNRLLPALGFSPNAEVAFDEFLTRIQEVPSPKRDIHFASQSSLLLVGQVQLHFLGVFEQFSKDFIVMKRKLYNDTDPDDYSSFGKHHATSALDFIKKYYNDVTIGLIGSIYKKDFENFGYSTDVNNSALPPDPMFLK